MTVSYHDIVRASGLLEGIVSKTPLVKSQTLSNICEAEVHLKLENLQYTASFKERGAYIKLASLTPEERAKGVIAVSAGNHAQGVAYNAKRLGIPATIVMPKNTPFTKVRHTRSHGAEVVLEGSVFAESLEAASKIQKERGLTFVHPFDVRISLPVRGLSGLKSLMMGRTSTPLSSPLAAAVLRPVLLRPSRPDARISR
ncbi:pyridoxal-phosphate dependent enzyme [Thalassospira xiamenensis]|uniref:pyridoxal-phosphate dependent enzyme n=1 Tax=Thalassospira xiamenensis TaxID=220697 RepID=UPI000A73D29A